MAPGHHAGSILRQQLQELNKLPGPCYFHATMNEEVHSASNLDAYHPHQL